MGYFPCAPRRTHTHSMHMTHTLTSPEFFITFDAHNLSFSLNHIYPSICSYIPYIYSSIILLSIFSFIIPSNICRSIRIFFGHSVHSHPYNQTRFDLIPYILTYTHTQTQCLSKYVRLAALSTLISNKKPPKKYNPMKMNDGVEFFTPIERNFIWTHFWFNEFSFLVRFYCIRPFRNGVFRYECSFVGFGMLEKFTFWIVV